MNRNSESINPHRLYKDRDKGIFMGVCSGVASYFNISLSFVRIALVISLFFSAGTVMFLYLILGFILEEKPMNVYKSAEEEVFWRNVSSSPKMTLSDLKIKLSKLDQKIQNLETKVTSKEFELSKKFRAL